MSNLQQIKKRIRSLDTTQKITHAMKHVSTVRFRRSQRMLVAARPYSNQLCEVLAHLAKSSKATDLHPFFKARPAKKIMVVIITSDRGMCGAFNSNIIKEAEKFIKQQRDQGLEVELSLIGRKGYDYFKMTKQNLLHNFPGIFEKLYYETAAGLAEGFEKSFINNDLDALYFIYHEFTAMSKQEIIIKQVLPIMPEGLTNKPAEAEPTFNADYIYEPSAEELLAKLAPQYLAFQIWRILLESSASEHAARMTAMEAAAHNEVQMRAELLLSYNRARQEAVTTELLDIIGGTNTLS